MLDEDSDESKAARFIKYVERTVCWVLVLLVVALAGALVYHLYKVEIDEVTFSSTCCGIELFVRYDGLWNVKVSGMFRLVECKG